jgi:hypothetical protein
LPFWLVLAIMVKLPASPSFDEPVRMSILPLLPADADPECNDIPPDCVTAEGDVTVISPLEPTTPLPLAIRISPPSPPLPAVSETVPPLAVSDIDAPAVIIRRPPAPVTLDPLAIIVSAPAPLPLVPTDTVSPPASADAALPVMTSIEPDWPVAAVPVVSNNEPLMTAAFSVDRLIPPLEPDSEAPLRSETLPPVPLTAAPPSMETAAPDPDPLLPALMLMVPAMF